MRYKTKRANATDIPIEVKLTVYERDFGRCIFCGAAGSPNAHYISRAHGGLGVEQNIVTACVECHQKMDNGKDSKRYRERAKRYLASLYADWDESKLIYRKGKEEC